jgi:hypothetical protein
MEGWYRFLGYAVVAALAPVLWLLARATVLWLLRMVTTNPDWWANAPLSHVIRRLGSRMRRGHRVARRRD